jgi:hypothetical protein
MGKPSSNGGAETDELEDDDELDDEPDELDDELLLELSPGRVISPPNSLNLSSVSSAKLCIANSPPFGWLLVYGLPSKRH